MNVREVCSLLKDAKVIMLGYAETAIPFNKNDLLMMDAYGKYAVEKVRSLGEEEYEIDLLLVPVKEGVA